MGKEQKQKAKQFVETWTKKIEETEQGKSNERQFCQLFWTTLLSEVFEIEEFYILTDEEMKIAEGR